jgi:hypothetical protein
MTLPVLSGATPDGEAAIVLRNDGDTAAELRLAPDLCTLGVALSPSISDRRGRRVDVDFRSSAGSEGGCLEGAEGCERGELRFAIEPGGRARLAFPISITTTVYRDCGAGEPGPRLKPGRYEVAAGGMIMPSVSGRLEVRR